MQPTTGLILSGGGARAAYQVGVLAGIAQVLPAGTANPFPVIVGTSAGAINAVTLASGADQFIATVQRLEAFWRGFTSHQVLRSDWPGVVRQAMRFIRHSLLGIGDAVPVALVDNAPLGDLLRERLDLRGIDAALAGGHLRAVAVTAFGYTGGQAVTFYQGSDGIQPWLRHRRVGVPTRLDVEHLLASAAIPLLFAPVCIGQDFYGDGAMRQSAPISPALHLGAERVLVVGVSGNARGPSASVGAVGGEQQPSLAQIGGHLLNSAFIDSLEDDLELLQRLNQLGRLLPADVHSAPLGLSPVEVMVVSPSQPLDEIAARHRHELPPALRLFLRGPGATKTSGAGLLSYLLFEAGYCTELIELGRRDALAKQAQLLAFLGVAP
ncbi:hypothetical protein PMM47T1_05539 [Pseudomonas sp. M47T1]|uniref:patatin-like phospholipase family protein n=1 Tax=unclassified Pseudomonas TaxID=196821 RepID=UPI0002606EBE|nr:patatin-like phospholipase family protein [Pseudomonas sp. M47T1]EIK97950.1 hypothetical protein PMM47T1_05539 [Pseudomonas sp. M47T1]